MYQNMLHYSSGFVGFLVLLLDLVVIYEVLNSNRELRSKLGWSLLIFFFPIVGLILYFLLSNRLEHRRYQTII